MSVPQDVSLSIEQVEASPLAAYLVRRDYFGTVNGVRYSLFQGASLELSELTAAHIELDQPQTLHRIDDAPQPEPAEERALDAPPAHRMVTGKRTRGKRAKPEGEDDAAPSA